MKLNFFLFFFFSFHVCAAHLQNEISEVFDKLHHVNGNDSAIEVTDTADSSESPKPLIKDNPSLRRRANGVKAKANVEDWSSLAQFEKLIKLEMENLAAQKSNVAETVSTKMNNNILKPEKHVSVSFNSPQSAFFSVCSVVALIENRSRLRLKNGKHSAGNA
jgi:hypothetical protein